MQRSIDSPNVDHTDVIKNEHLLLCNYASTDKCECRVKVRLPNYRGKEDLEKCTVEGQCLLIMHLVGSKYITKFHWELMIPHEVKSFMSYGHLNLEFL